MNFWATLPRPIIGLSPMDGVTDASFRHVVATQGKPDVSFTEFTHVHDVCRGPEFLLDSLIYDEIERPIVAQLYGKDPDLFYQAAHAVCALGFDGLDINMGCPSRNVASSGSGAGLIRTPDLARTIIQATRQGIDDWVGGQSMESAGIKPARAEAIHRMNQRRGSMPGKRRLVPVSVKTRLGYDEVIVERWVEHLITEHPCAISLHGRTLQQMYRGEADWEAIARAAQVVKGTGILLFGNGDVQNLTEVVQRVRETRVDGVLIGRGALGAPWLFREKERARLHLHEDTPMVVESSVLPLSERFQVLLDHARHFEHVHGVSQFRRMRKHLGWYCTGFPHAAALRANMFRLSSVADVEKVLLDYRMSHASDTSTVSIETSLDPEAPLTLPVSRCG